MSSLPPGTRHPPAKPVKLKPKANKNPGGRPGHAKHERPLIPADKCDDAVSLMPTECRRCGTKRAGEAREPLRYQVYEPPEIQPIVTEYQRHRLSCPCGGETTCAALPSRPPSLIPGV